METVEIVKAHIPDALNKSAVLVCGGGEMPGTLTHHFIEPTILDHISHDALVNIEEMFGPFLPLARFENEANLLSMIEDNKYRLFSAIFKRDLGKGIRMAEIMNFGTAHINSSSSYWAPDFPASGSAGSANGHGRSGGKWSIEDSSEIRNITLNPGK